MTEIKDWINVVGHNITLDSSNSKDDSFINLIRDNEFQLSPITKLLLDSWSSLFDTNKNLILIYPDDILRPIPLLSYFYSKTMGKSTLVFTSGKISSIDHNIARHNRNYCLSRWEGDDFLFTDIPMGYIKNNDLHTQLFLPHTNNKYKKIIRQKTQDSLINSNSKIILNGFENYTKVSNILNKIYLDDDLLENQLDEFETDIGCIIFENADRFISSNYKTNSFINWIKKNSPKKTKFLFHFSNLTFNNKNVDKLKLNTNSLILNFEKNILLQNDYLKEKSLEYFKNKPNYHLDILNSYNLDKVSDFNVSLLDFDLIDSLDVGNVDYLFKYNLALSQKINQDNLKNKQLYGIAFKLLYDLPNLIVNPSFYKIKFRKFDDWKTMSVPEFLDYYERKIENEYSDNKFLLENFISNIKNIYLELSKTKRFYEENSYSRIGKEYLAYHIAENPEEYFGNNNPLIIGTINKFEKVALESKINSDNILIFHLKDLIKSNNNFEDYNLLLSGKIPSNYAQVLFKQFKRVLFLNYTGKNKETVIRQINKFTSEDLYQYSKDYSDEFYNFFEKEDDAFVEFLEGKELIQEENRSYKPNFNNSIVNGRFSNNFDSKENSYEYDIESIKVELKSVKSKDSMIKSIPLNRKYLHFGNIDKLEDSLEDTIDKISVGEYIIILDNSRGFRELFKDIFYPNFEIDFELASYWSDVIIQFCEERNMPPDRFYNIYKAYGGKRKLPTIKNWLNGKIILPKVDQLEILAKVIDDDWLSENKEIIYEECRKIKSLNIVIGRKIGHLIRSIITEDLDFNELSYEEELMYDHINNNIYQLISFIDE